MNDLSAACITKHKIYTVINDYKNNVNANKTNPRMLNKFGHTQYIINIISLICPFRASCMS